MSPSPRERRGCDWGRRWRGCDWDDDGEDATGDDDGKDPTAGDDDDGTGLLVGALVGLLGIKQKKQMYIPVYIPCVQVLYTGYVRK